MPKLCISVVGFGHAQNTLSAPIGRTLIERGYAGWLVDEYVVITLEYDEIVKQEFQRL